jgi:glycerophosphoryl diester phosphodiesterase
MVTSDLKAPPKILPVLAGGPLLIAHRGGAGLAPENTVAAFARAVQLWQPDMFELDVHASADGACVVIHDPTIDRTTDGTGSVGQLTLAELQKFDAGYRFTTDGGKTFPFRGKGVRIPTIDEVLAAFPAMRLTVELKTGAAQKPLFAAVERAQAQDRVIAAAEFRRYRTEFGTWKGCLSACREDALPFLALHYLRLSRFGRMNAHVVQTCERLRGRQIVSPSLIRALHAKNILIHVWTVNERADMERLLDWGVDGIITDRPDRLAAVLHERVGRPLPPGSLHPGSL